MMQIPSQIFTASTSDSQKEAESFEDANYEKEAKKKAYKRKEDIKDHSSCITVIILWIISIVVILIGIIWTWHVITPESLHFLLQPQIDKLQTMLFSASLVKIGQDFYSKNF